MSVNHPATYVHANQVPLAGQACTRTILLTKSFQTSRTTDSGLGGDLIHVMGDGHNLQASGIKSDGKFAVNLRRLFQSSDIIAHQINKSPDPLPNCGNAQQLCSDNDRSYGSSAVLSSKPTFRAAGGLQTRVVVIHDLRDTPPTPAERSG